MVRATAAEIKKLFLGVWPPRVTDSNVGDILAGIDYKLDGFVKKYYKVDLSTTGTDVTHISNMIGKQEILHIMWAHAGGYLSRVAEPKIFTDEIVAMIEAVVTDTSEDGATMIELEGSYSDT